MQYERDIDTKPPLVLINYTDLVKQFDTSKISPMMFPITNNYTNTKIQEAKWISIVDPVNKFFQKTTKEDQYEILIFIDKCLHEIAVSFDIMDKGNYGRSEIISAMRRLGDLLFDLEHKIDLCNKLFRYVDEFIYIGDFANAGSNPQDRAPITYREEEAKEVVTLALLSKLLFPIFGQILFNFHARSSRENLKSKREVYTSMMLDRLLNFRFKSTIDKLRIYVNDYVVRSYNDYKIMSDSSTKTTNGGDEYFYVKDAFKSFTPGAFMGLTTDSLTDSTIADLLIKAFVNGNIDDNEKSHIINYMHSTVTANINKQLHERTDFRIFRRTDPNKTKRGGDQETPQFEIDSVVSDRSCDITMVINTEVPKVAAEVVALCNAEELYPKVLAHHRFHKVTPSAINQICLSKFFGEQLGGGESIFYLTNDKYAELLSAFQIYLFDNNYLELLFMSSAKQGFRKLEPTEMDSRIENSIENRDSYKQCKLKFQQCLPIFKKTMNSLLAQTTEHEQLCNLPDALFVELNQTNVNGTVLEYSVALFNQILIILKG